MKLKKPKWQLRTEHDNLAFRIMKQFHFLDSQNQVRHWDGPRFFLAFAKEGHDKVDFNDCQCSRKD